MAAPFSRPLLFVLAEFVAVVSAVLLLPAAVSLLRSAVDRYGDELAAAT